jgi:hypothetical protein
MKDRRIDMTVRVPQNKAVSSATLVANLGIMLDLIAEKRNREIRFYMDITKTGITLNAFAQTGRSWRREMPWVFFENNDAESFKELASTALDVLRVRVTA